MNLFCSLIRRQNRWFISVQRKRKRKFQLLLIFCKTYYYISRCNSSSVQFFQRDTCTPFLITGILLTVRLLLFMKNKYLREIIDTRKQREFPSRLFLLFPLSIVGYCASVGLWTCSLGRPRRIATATALELFSSPRPVGDAPIRSIGAWQIALSWEKLHRSLPMLVGQHFGISGEAKCCCIVLDFSMKKIRR